MPGPVPCVALSDWVAFARSSYKASRRAVLRACDEVKVSEDASWTRNVSHDNLSRDWICESCSCSFPTKQLLGTHMWKVHHVRRATRSHVDGTHCPACLLEFHTRDRLLRHLEDKSPICRSYVLEHLPKLEPDVVEQLDLDAIEVPRSLLSQGRKRAWADKPCYRLAGPTRVLLEEDKSRHPLGPCRRWL